MNFNNFFYPSNLLIWFTKHNRAIHCFKNLCAKPSAIFLIFFLLTNNSFGQNRPNIQLSYQTLLSSDAELPFWLVHNQQGKYDAVNPHNQVALFNGYYKFDSLFKSPIDIELAGTYVALYSNSFSNNFNELFAKAHLWGWKLEAGLFHEPEYFNQLSSTNGNIDRSNNNRPYPRIRFGTNEFIPFLFWKRWFSFKAEYDEGILNDERVVSNTRLHHKSLYARAKFTNNVYASFGLNHFVMWGGISPVYGELPSSFKDYLTYITGGAGTSNFPTTDQQNVAGNQLGSYHLQIDFPIKQYKASLYISHPFEDHSGMEFDNWRDNLYGIFINLNEEKFIDKIVYEFMYTIHQSGHIHQFGVMRGRDNYFNHGYYRSGFTYKGYTMASPLFSPVLIGDQGSGIGNTRILMHHVGFSGKLHKSVTWDGKFTYSRNMGTYNTPYEPQRNQFSAVFNLNIPESKIPFDLTVSVAGDLGQLYPKRGGIMLSISKKWHQKSY